MLTIYGVYRSRATRILWTAAELGIPFRQVPVIQANRLADPMAADAPLNTQSRAFLAVNPNGQIPSIDDNGLILHESLGIALYLARKHGGPLAPATVTEEGQMLSWMLWAATGCEPHTIQILYNRVGKPPAERDETMALAAIEAMRRPFSVLDKALAEGGGFVVGGRFTVADIMVAEVFRYAMPAPDLFDANPHVKSWFKACQARPAFVEMMQKRDLEPA
jgi:glutathione S-transferase